MKALLKIAPVLLLVGMAGGLIAGELKSGLQPGDLVGPFDVEKCGGALNDGKEVGANFCYRCMLGNKPVVMVFAHQADDSLAALVKALDKKVAENDDQKLSSFVNLLGENQDALKATAKEFAAKHKVENVALVVPHEFKNGPEEFELNAAVDVTVMIYREGKVKVSHAIPAGQLNSETIQKIVADTSTILD